MLKPLLLLVTLMVLLHLLLHLQLLMGACSPEPCC
jgi:hypothetical protein